MVWDGCYRRCLAIHARIGQGLNLPPERTIRAGLRIGRADFVCALPDDCISTKPPPRPDQVPPEQVEIADNQAAIAHAH